MRTEDLQQFKGMPLDTKSAEAYAKVRLGLGDDWCAYAWSWGIGKYSAKDAIQVISTLVEDREAITSRITLDLHEQMGGSDHLPNNQMVVKLVNAPSIKVLIEAWGNEEELETKIFLVDWNLLQDFLK